MSQIGERNGRQLRHLVLERQRRHRVPGIHGSVVRDGAPLWQGGVGCADVGAPESPPDADSQFLIASITKTFTAVLVMALRDEGKLALDDSVEKFVPESGHTALSLRQMLAHVSGMQREPVGDSWEQLEFPDREALVRGFGEAERVLRPHHLWHYSNLAYAMLGEVVSRVEGRPWAECLQARVLSPLGMSRTTVGLASGAVSGYYVTPYSDVPVPEPVVDQRAMAPCGALASTPDDMGRWAAFLADPVEEVLHPDTLDEMCQPQILADLDRWQLAWGLGLMLLRRGERIFVGHTGGMPGHVSGLFTHRPSGTGAVALMNSTSSPDPAALAVDLVECVLDQDPADPEPWQPGRQVPAELRGIIGHWYSEGSPYAFSVREGHLEARATDAPEHQPPSVFAPVGENLYRTVSGRETGELLRITRDERGEVVKMNWASYRVTREPLGFGQ